MTLKQSLENIFKTKFLRTVLFVSLVSVIMLPVYIIFFVYPSFTELLAESAENDAIRAATHLKDMHISTETALTKDSLSPDFSEMVEDVMKDFKLMKLKVFAPSGEIIYSTDPEDIGKVNKKWYFHQIVAKGKSYAKLVRKDTLSLEGQMVTADVVETYVPIMVDGEFVGAFEIYYDITVTKEKLNRLLSRSYFILFAVAFVLLVAVVASSFKAGRSIAERRQAEKQVVKQNVELAELNSELSVLYTISSAISRTLDIDELFSIILDTITSREIFKVERKGGIFIVEGERMHLVFQLGLTETFVKAHDNMKVGDCLCGLAAKTGEVIISTDSNKDDRHTIRYPGIAPHGHIIVPLKAMNKLVGVLYLYLPADTEVDERVQNMLRSIGNQIGIAIENARLYKKTKELSLHDPLTGLANRRLMYIELERSFAKAKRYETPLSVIMLDIDYFKKYNDTYGHAAGDKLLKDIAEIVQQSVRKADLVARYGGEEFFILLPETRLTEAYAAAERIRRAVERRTEVTISLGVSSYRQDMQIKEDLIKKADEALYQAKERGRNRVELSA
jgi:diguanylate cyclase (GGDEF)-like protein